MMHKSEVLTAIFLVSIAGVTLSSPNALTAISTTMPTAGSTITPSAYAQTTTDSAANGTDSTNLTDLTDSTSIPSSEASDTLFVGDIADDTIKIIDITDGEGQVFIAKNSGEGNSGEGGYRLQSPTGIIVVNDTLLVANQNANTGKAGEILKFDGETGDFEGFLVRHNDDEGPWAPRGIVVSPDGEILYVASFEGRGSTKSDLAPGAILAYDTQTGEFQGSFTPDEGILPEGTEFHPRGLLFSPDDGLLYISGTGDLTSDIRAGYVLTFDPESEEFGLFVSSQDAPSLHRPEGLAFDSEGNLWATSFRASEDDTDKILAFNSEGELTNTINLYESGNDRTFAQAILFGPDGDLFVPISNTGELRRYDVDTGEYAVVTEAGNPLGAPWYLTFKNTDPSTLEYDSSD
ncbi:MAG TPA: SMP-30/gluconolactonase/LRE family protein [Nitrososphaera sp.]|nr:SMP-30/gluconolactonase/LRE family protein [Nitrososphaera sp.]